MQTPLRRFLHTETGGAAVLLLAAVAALVWVNVHASSYESFWGTTLSVELGDMSVSLDLRHWVNSGLMTFFFFVLGLEARREFDLGELRERRRFALPLLAGVGGMAIAVAIYLAFNAGRSSAQGWGVAMSTDTAFALGLLALVGPRFPDRLRAFMLTVVVVDDILALAVIATVYTEDIDVPALLAACGLFGAVLVARFARGAPRRGLRSARRGGVGRTPGVGRGAGHRRARHRPARVRLPHGALRARAGHRALPHVPRAADARAGAGGRRGAEVGRVAERAAAAALPPVDELRDRAALRARQRRDRDRPRLPGARLHVLDHARDPRGLRGRQAHRDPRRVVAPQPAERGPATASVGWAAVAGGGTIAGIGFTVSLLVASVAFEGGDLEEAKLGILSAALAAATLTWLLFLGTALLPKRLQVRALLGSGEPIVDLYIEVDPDRDHVRGPLEAPVTVVEYGDFECPFCGQAEPAVRELLADFADVRYVWRHLPLSDVHPLAQLAAEAAEAAADQGAFWEMHDVLLAHQDALRGADLVRYAQELGLDLARFSDALRTRSGAPRVAEDVDSADLSGVSGTPTFFVNGRRHYGAYDIGTLSDAVRAAGARATLSASGGDRRRPDEQGVT